MVTNVKRFCDPIDPTDPKYHGQVLWVVYGPNCFPTMFCCMIRNHAGQYPGAGLVIWGYSVYKGEPGFRTLGVDLIKWMKENEATFYDSQTGAMQVICKLTQPKDSAYK